MRVHPIHHSTISENSPQLRNPLISHHTAIGHPEPAAHYCLQYSQSYGSAPGIIPPSLTYLSLVPSCVYDQLVGLGIVDLPFLLLLVLVVRATAVQQVFSVLGG